METALAAVFGPAGSSNPAELCLAFSAMDLSEEEPIATTAEAEAGWIAHVNAMSSSDPIKTSPSCNSWYLGANIPGKVRIFMPYIGGVGMYRERCDQVAANEYEGFTLSGRLTP